MACLAISLFISFYYAPFNKLQDQSGLGWIIEEKNVECCKVVALGQTNVGCGEHQLPLDNDVVLLSGVLGGTCT